MILYGCSAYSWSDTQPPKANDGCTTPDKGFVNFFSSPINLFITDSTAVFRQWWFVSHVNSAVFCECPVPLNKFCILLNEKQTIKNVISIYRCCIVQYAH